MRQLATRGRLTQERESGSMSVKAFGEADGVTIFEVSLRSAGGAQAKVLSWGGVLEDLVVPSANGPQRVVLGLNNMADYVAHSPHFGATAGRFANRIARGRFAIDGHTYETPCNEGGKNALHGGGKGLGFGARAWKLGLHDMSSVTMSLHSPAGEAGYPGNLNVNCSYRLLETATLEIEMRAWTDAPTLVNLAHHSYFNLDGSSDARDHELTLNADFYTPVDGENIPTGEILKCAGTPFDFAAPRAIRNAEGQRYDHNFVIAPMPGADGLAHAATLRSRRNGLAMDVWTSEPGLQFYDGAKLNLPVAGLDGASAGAHAGLCFEAQTYPDAPNRRHFPSAVVRPSAAYRQVTQYRFG